MNDYLYDNRHDVASSKQPTAQKRLFQDIIDTAKASIHCSPLYIIVCAYKASSYSLNFTQIYFSIYTGGQYHSQKNQK